MSMAGSLLPAVKRKPLPYNARLMDFELSPLHPVNIPTITITETDNGSPQPGNHRDRHSPTHCRHSEAWTPLFLRRPVLLIFICVYLLLSVALATLFGYSQSHQGLSSADEKNHYLWTYGPVAVLTVVAAFWKRVAYRTKQLTPWKLMANRSQPASTSVLLDYISPLDIVVPFKAIKNGHWMTSLVVFSDLVFSVLIIAATGIFTVQNTDITSNNVQLRVSNKFDLSNFNLSTIDSQPSMLAYSARNLRLDYPSGTTAQYAIQAFDGPSKVNGSVTTTVDTFTASLDCEPADLLNISFISYPSNQVYSLPSVRLQYNLASLGCSASFDTLTVYNPPANNSLGIAEMRSCGNGTLPRLFVSMTRFRQTSPVNATSTNATTFRVLGSNHISCTPRYQITKSSVNKRLTITQDYAYDQIMPLQSHFIEDNTAVSIAQGVILSLSDVSTHTGRYSNGLRLFPTTADNFVKSLISVYKFSDEQAASAFWLQYKSLVDASIDAYQAIAAQLAAQKFLVPANEIMSGSMTTTETRIFVRILSFVLIQAGLVLMLCVSIVLYFSKPSTMVQYDPGSISGVATMLSSSSDFAGILGQEDNFELPLGSSVLGRYKYRICFSPENLQHSMIQIMEDRGKEQLHPKRSKGYFHQLRGKIKLPLWLRVPRRLRSKRLGPNGADSKDLTRSWWQPLILQPLPYILVSVLPIVYIIVLQVLLVESTSHSGLVAVRADSWVHYGWTYIPAILMACVGWLYESVNFNLLLRGPYERLKGGAAIAKHSVTDHPLSQIALINLWTSARRFELAIFLTTLAVLVVPVLTIAVSGLYVRGTFNQTVTVQQLVGWDFNSAPQLAVPTALAAVFDKVNATDLAVTSFDASTVDAIVTANLSYPKWSYQELALPFVEVANPLNDSKITAKTPTGSLKTTVPTIRGGLNCTAIPQDTVVITYSNFDSSVYPTDARISLWPSAKYQGNRRCQNWTQTDVTAGVTPYGSELCRIAIFNVSSTYTLNGCPLDPQMVFLPADGSDQQSFGYFSTAGDPTHPYCPLYVGMVGTTSTQKITAFTWFVCSASISRIDAEIEINLPEYTVISAKPNENSATLLYMDQLSINNQNLNVRLKVSVNGNSHAAAPIQFSPLNFDGNDFLSFHDTADNQNYDSFISALEYGQNNVSVNDLVGSDKVPVLFSAVQHLWRIILAQGLSGFMSAQPKDIKAFAPTAGWTGTLLDPTALRLQQSVVSTRILQGVLAMLSFCAIVALFFMERGRILPDEPCSIAAVARLLINSDMLTIMTSYETEEMYSSSSTQQKIDPWHGYLFSLGWWRRPDGTRRYGIDVGKAKRAT